MRTSSRVAGVLLAVLTLAGCGRLGDGRSAEPRSQLTPTECPLPASAEITISTVASKTELTADCYSALAGVSVTIVFVNQTTDLDGDHVPLSLSLYASPEKGYTETTENGAPVFTMHRENALFVGEETQGTILYVLPALDPGMYWLQWDVAPAMLNAWVEAT